MAAMLCFRSLRSWLRCSARSRISLVASAALALLEYRYDVPFKFTGKIVKLTFDLDPGRLASKP
jgi:hypothetical protein